MKKLLLFSLALAIGLCSFAQRTYTLKNVKSEKARSQMRIADKETFKKAPSVTDALNSSSSIKGTDIVTIIDIGQSANAYGYGYAGGQKSLVWANDDLNAVTNIHRETAATYSGNLAYDLSLDNGQTFENNIRIYESNISGGTYNIDAARYPNSAIYNPVGNTDPANAWFAYFAPNLDGSNEPDGWGGYSYGVANLVDHADTTKHLRSSHADFFQYVPEAYTITTLGEAWLVDPNYDWSSGTGVYQENLIINQGTFVGNDFEYDEWLFDAPMTGTGWVYDEKVAFGPDGLTGYISILGNPEEIPFSTDAVYPTVYKTTDGGENWEDPVYVQLGGPDGIEEVLWYLTDEQIAELFVPPLPARDEILYTTAFDHDLVVDALGNLHIGVIVGLTGSSAYSIVIEQYTFAAFDIYTLDGGTTWYGNFLGSCKNFTGTFGDLEEYNRINASVTTDGMIITMTWLDTQLEGVEENNQPDVYARGFNLETNCLSGDEAGADLPDNVTAFSEGMWQAFFEATSYYTLTVDDQYIVPIVYEDMDPLDPTVEVQFKYIQDFYYTDADFIWESNNPDPGVGIEPVENNLTFVSQNYPNPFNNTSVITVKLEKATDLSLEVFNLTGQKVYEINNGKVGSGSHILTIDASNLSSGVYFYTVFAGENSVTKKMIVN